MTQNLKDLVAKAVEKNIAFQGLAGALYTVQDLVHQTSLVSLNKMYKRAKKELDSIDSDTLFDTSNSAKKSELQFQVDTIKEVFAYKKALADAEKEKQAKRERKAQLMALKTEKELEEFKGKSLEEIEKEIEALDS